MTQGQWKILLDVIDGKVIDPVRTGFIIDSPWLPNWAGMTIKDYFDDDQKWFDSNLKAVKDFPEVMFLPGFWSEFGMCTEPSAFGSECVWHENNLPFAERIITDIEQVKDLKKPDPRKDALTPRVIERLRKFEPQINDAGHEIKFAVSRGPLNLASFLMGNTEFLMAILTNPEETKQLLEIVTEFTVDWLRFQKESFPSIEGIFILDDIVGFIGEEDFKSTAMPYLRKIYEAFDADVRFFHNDAPGIVCAPYLSEIGVNLFNYSFEHSIVEMKQLTDNKVALLGNLPPRDVLAKGTPEDVVNGVKAMFDGVEEKSRIIASCGGGMAPATSSENIRSFIETVRDVS